MDEIDVTATMLKAGVKELSLVDSYDDWYDTAHAVYIAMERARRSEADSK